MENITYTYEIIAVDEAARCMEVVYSSEGHQTMHIGARLPFEGESLDAVVKMFAPIALWIEQATPITVPLVGVTGSVAVSLTPEVVAPQPTPQPPTQNEFTIPIDIIGGV